jgi:hypothetical protein
VNSDVGVDEVCQQGATPSIRPAQRYINRPPFFYPTGLWHAAQGGNRVLQTVASRKNRDDVAQSCDFEIDVGICNRPECERLGYCRI